MEIKEIKISPRFEKSYKRLSKRNKETAKEKEKIFKEDPFNPRLKVHKLKGKEKEVWAFWVNYSCRIKFIFLNEKEVLFLDIGMHKIYSRRDKGLL